MTPLLASLMRIRGLLGKEILQIRRDPSSILLAIVMPVVLLFLFGYGVSLNPTEVPVAIVTSDHSPEARQLVARFQLSTYFAPIQVGSMQQAEELVQEGVVDGIIHLQGNFSTTLFGSHQAPIQIIVNGIDANRARLIQGYAMGTVQQWDAIRQSLGETEASLPVVVKPRIWFNESSESSYFLVPGLIVLIMTLIGILLTALVIAREWERGTMEAILVTPVRVGELLLGKTLPYFVLGMLGMGMTVAGGAWIFGVPLRGSLPLLVLLSSIFMLASLGFGLVISATVRVQFVAAQISVIAGFLPAFFLSGLLFDLGSTPKAIRVISHLIPARYFVEIVHTLFLAGNIGAVLWPAALPLTLMAVFFFMVVRRRLTKRLE
ncbi:MAG: ABC transporter permease [Deltaproteobacteria bacterium]